jgi:hypothetical protein
MTERIRKYFAGQVEEHKFSDLTSELEKAIRTKIQSMESHETLSTPWYDFLADMREVTRIAGQEQMTIEHPLERTTLWEGEEHVLRFVTENGKLVLFMRELELLQKLDLTTFSCAQRRSLLEMESLLGRVVYSLLFYTECLVTIDKNILVDCMLSSFQRSSYPLALDVEEKKGEEEECEEEDAFLTSLPWHHPECTPFHILSVLSDHYLLSLSAPRLSTVFEEFILPLFRDTHLLQLALSKLTQLAPLLPNYLLFRFCGAISAFLASEDCVNFREEHLKWTSFEQEELVWTTMARSILPRLLNSQSEEEEEESVSTQAPCRLLNSTIPFRDVSLGKKKGVLRELTKESKSFK